MSSSASPLFRFGIIADPQYAAIAPHVAMDRYYANSLAKVAEAIEVFNGEELSFVMTLGDVIDRSFSSFDDILPVYEKLRHETVGTVVVRDIERDRLGDALSIGTDVV
ncbi:hypothetical protein ACCS96_32855, partial [Rhizobium ruizarguesonis]